MFNSGDLLDKDTLVFNADANTVPILQVSPEVSTYCQNETLPIRIFNQLMTSGLEPEVTKEDLPLFGTHVREAVETIRKFIKL